MLWRRENVGEEIQRIAETRPSWLTFDSSDPYLAPEPTFPPEARLFVAPDLLGDLTARLPEGSHLTFFGLYVEVDPLLTDRA